MHLIQFIFSPGVNCPDFLMAKLPRPGFLIARTRARRARALYFCHSHHRLISGRRTVQSPFYADVSEKKKQGRRGQPCSVSYLNNFTYENSGINGPVGKQKFTAFDGIDFVIHSSRPCSRLNGIFSKAIRARYKLNFIWLRC